MFATQEVKHVHLCAPANNQSIESARSVVFWRILLADFISNYLFLFSLRSLRRFCCEHDYWGKGARNISSNINRRVAAFQRKWLCALGLVLRVSSFSMVEHYCFFFYSVLAFAAVANIYSLRQMIATDLPAPSSRTAFWMLLLTLLIVTLGMEICGKMEGEWENTTECTRILFFCPWFFLFFPHLGSDIYLSQDHSYLFVQELTSKWSNWFVDIIQICFMALQMSLWPSTQ